MFLSCATYISSSVVEKYIICNNIVKYKYINSDTRVLSLRKIMDIQSYS
jgi:hypothetical protein